MTHRDIDLRELIINGLASLISANAEFGIKHCLPMTYDADPAHRVIFAHVFARVVSKGIRFDPQEEQKSAIKQSKLCEVCPSCITLQRLLTYHLPHATDYSIRGCGYP